MSHQDKKSNFGVGLLVGAVAGALAGLFLAPKSGKENREEAARMFEQLKKDVRTGKMDKRIRDIFGDVSDRSKELYEEAQEELMNRVNAAQDTLDKNEYFKMVKDVVEKMMSQFGEDKREETSKRLKKGLEEEWEEKSKSRSKSKSKTNSKAK